jgi:hypothetical protein
MEKVKYFFIYQLLLAVLPLFSMPSSRWMTAAEALILYTIYDVHEGCTHVNMCCFRPAIGT